MGASLNQDLPMRLRIWFLDLLSFSQHFIISNYHFPRSSCLGFSFKCSFLRIVYLYMFSLFQQKFLLCRKHRCIFLFLKHTAHNLRFRGPVHQHISLFSDCLTFCLRIGCSFFKFFMVLFFSKKYIFLYFSFYFE